MATFDKPITFDKLIQDISARYHLGPKSRSLVEETVDIIDRDPGGIDRFLDRLKVAGLTAEVASWLAGADPVPLSGHEVEQTLGPEVITKIADKAGVSARFARTVLGYAIPKNVIPHATLESAPVAAQNAPMAVPHVPSIPARLSLDNKNGVIVYSGTVEDEATRATITDSLNTAFGANKITGELAIDEHAGPAGWVKALKVELDNFRTPGLQVLYEGNAVSVGSVGGTIPGSDRDRIISSPKSILGPKYAFATIAGSGATETAMASPMLRADVSGTKPIGTPDQSALGLPTVYFATNSAEVPPESKAFLQQAAVIIKPMPVGTVVWISGFSDSTGNPVANMKLSQLRANAVRQVLVDAGVNPAILSAKGYGTYHSVAGEHVTMEGRSCATMEVRLHDEERRVELRIAQQ